MQMIFSLKHDTDFLFIYKSESECLFADREIKSFLFFLFQFLKKYCFFINMKIKIL